MTTRTQCSIVCQESEHALALFSPASVVHPLSYIVPAPHCGFKLSMLASCFFCVGTIQGFPGASTHTENVIQVWAHCAMCVVSGFMNEPRVKLAICNSAIVLWSVFCVSLPITVEWQANSFRTPVLDCDCMKLAYARFFFHCEVLIPPRPFPCMSSYRLDQFVSL